MTKSKTAVLNLDKTTEYLQMPRSTAYRFAQEGKIPGQKVGRHWRFRRMDQTFRVTALSHGG